MLRPERGDVWLVYGYAVLAGLLGLALPVGVQAIIGLVAGGMLLQPVVILITAVIIGTALAGVVQLLQVSAVERLQQRLFARRALEWSERLGILHPDVANREHLPETVTRFFEVVIIQKSLAKLLVEAVASALAIFFGVILLVFYHPMLALAGVSLLVMLVLSLWFTGRSAYETAYEESSWKYSVAHWLQELGRQFPTFQKAQPTSLNVSRTDGDVAKYLEARQAHFRVIMRQSIAAVVFKTLITGALLILGTILVVRRQITLGQFVASELVVVSILAGVEKLILNVGTVYDLLAAVTKAAHVDVLPVLPLSEGRVLRSDGAGMRVEIDGLTYKYPAAEQASLNEISLNVGAGECIALLGAEGAGTSTLLKAIAGLYDGISGSIALDGVSIRDVETRSLRRSVGLIESSPQLIDGSIEENITMGRSGISHDDVQWAMDFAGMDRFVRAQPRGLATSIGAGRVVPLETARRIALARAIVSRPRLLLFDTFFHNLDPVERAPLIERICDPTRNWTVIAASHDQQFLQRTQRIVLMKRGRVTREAATSEFLSNPLVAAQLVVDETGTFPVVIAEDTLAPEES